ncbi:MAG: ThiJ/PfpI family protein [Pedosphaera sp.]|nr:ThiJ/PfpI family protein [Pedosphaera sp.]
MAQKKLQGLRVAVIAADGFEQVEVTSPISALQKNGAEVEVISLRPGNIKGMNLLWPGKKIHVNRTIFTADPDDYDALHIPGGFINPDFLRQSERILNFVREFDRSGKPISVICHGPWVLVSAGLVKDRTLTSWPGIKDDVKNAGGIWKDQAVVRDGNWVSSKGPQDLPLFNRAMVSHFAEHSKAAHPVHAHNGGNGSILPTLGWFAAGAAVAAAIYGGTRAASSRRTEEEEPMVTPEI